MIKFFLSFLIFIISIPTCMESTDSGSGNSQSQLNYDLSSPDKIFILPPSLYEISGITELDANSIACVQDENGLVFIYDLNKGQVTRQFIFGAEGDYEGITRVNQTLYVLRSDEVIIEIKSFNSDKYERKAFLAKFPGKDAESICYYKENNILLLIPKEVLDDKSLDKDKRYIYSFDLNSKEILKDPFMVLDLDEIDKFAIDNAIKVPMKKKKDKKDKPDIKMHISAMGIHPFTNNLYAISGSERLLFVFTMDGSIEWIEKLNKDLFPQPEGITFLPDGDLLISNEGRNGSPTLLRFAYNQSNTKE